MLAVAAMIIINEAGNTTGDRDANQEAGSKQLSETPGFEWMAGVENWASALGCCTQATFALIVPCRSFTIPR